jgi:hypothetical protein
MRYLWVGLLVASIASVEFVHELGTGGMPGGLGSVCIAPQVHQEAAREVLLQQLKSH